MFRLSSHRLKTCGLSRLCKICEKYGLIDRGCINSWSIGLLCGGNKRKIFKRIFNLKNQKQQQSKIKIVSKKRIESDIFNITTIYIDVNTTKSKAKKLCRLFEYGYNLELIEKSIVESTILYYNPIVTYSVDIVEKQKLQIKNKNLVINVSVL